MSEKENPAAVKKKDTTWTQVALSLTVASIVVVIMFSIVNEIHDRKETPSFGYDAMERWLKNDQYLTTHKLIIEAMEDDTVNWGEYMEINEMVDEIDTGHGKQALRAAIAAYVG